MKHWPLILLLFLVWGCNQPSNDLIKSDFQRLYPSAKIVVIKPVEENASTIRVSINYRNQGDESIYEDVFLYKKIDGEWVNTWRKSAEKKDSGN